MYFKSNFYWGLMKNICCTIVTPSHIHKAIVLLNSVKKHDPSFQLFVLITEQTEHYLADIEAVFLSDLIEADSEASLLAEKYHQQMDELRWSLKPVFIRYLLERNDDSIVLYCDCDMFFVERPSYLINSLKKGGIVLTPHWRPLDPSVSLHNFRLNFQDGLFNAGCVAANTKGIPALNWWAKACFSACEADREKGLWHDQRYLDLMIIYFSQTVICRHKGYNIADWNHHLRESLFEKGNKEKIILIHFSANTIKKILSGKDYLLESYYEEYIACLNNTLNNLITMHVNHYSLPDKLGEA